MIIMSMSEVYTDTVGSVHQEWPPSYARAITKDCPSCGAVPYTLCTYSPAKPRLRFPCVARASA